jgi:hypothetical protein
MERGVMESLFVNGGFAHRRAPVPGTDDGIFHAQRMPGGAFDPEAGLTLSGTMPQGVLDANLEAITGANITSPVVFAGDVYFPASPADGCIWQKGGAGAGACLVIRDSGARLRVRCGNGGESVAGGGTPTTAVALIDITDFPQDDATHTIVWELRGAPQRVRLWIDGILKGDYTDTNNPANANCAGGDQGKYITGAGGSNVGTEPDNDYAGGATGNLRVYHNQTVAA